MSDSRVHERGPAGAGLPHYGESGDWESERFTDQTELYSSKSWRPILFDARDIAADPQLEVMTVSAPRR